MRGRYAQFAGAVVIPKKSFAEAAVSAVINSNKKFWGAEVFFFRQKTEGILAVKIFRRCR